MKLIVISNRLPFTVRKEDGELHFDESAGGLATGLNSFLSKRDLNSNELQYVWIGWPGLSVSPSEQELIRRKARTDFDSVAVFPSRELVEQFYLGLCNKTLWPLFHYFPSYANFDDEHWAPYVQANEIYCEAAASIIEPDDIVWVHDYHLMLLPQMLRARFPKLAIGFFLHIPFPSFEIFRLLPQQWRVAILEGLLGADLIGFHTYDYTQYFLRCVSHILGRDNDMGRITLEDRIAKTETFPMGIDYQKFSCAAEIPAVRAEKEALEKQLSGRSVILSVDRLDYSKGISQRLLGYNAFLEAYPEYRGKVVLLCVVVPSRIGVDRYRQMKRHVDEIIGEINGKFGNVHWTPILYQYRHLSFNSLSALYAVSDIALVTPLRDGMNLIAKEYLAARTDQSGVLVLSEMTGACAELGEAITINPNSVSDIAGGIKIALDMPLAEQVRRNASMRARLNRYDITRWAEDFLNTVITTRKAQERFEARLLTGDSLARVESAYQAATRRLLFLDYDGTLAPFVDYPEMAKPTEQLIKMLVRSANDPMTEIVLISGRDRGQLHSWFADQPIGLVAEHGVWVKPIGSEWRLIKPLVNDWKERVRPILRTFVDRLPGAFLEEKEYMFAWHYRRSDPELASARCKELIDNLVEFTANIDVQVLHGNKVVEIRNAGVNKGIAGLYWLGLSNFDFVLAIGDDWTDEDLFKVLPPNAYTIKVGMASSHARFNLHNHLEVLKLLDRLFLLSPLTSPR